MRDSEGSFVAKASTTIDAPIAGVWDALTNPEIIKQYMFGTTVISEWKEGSAIVWRGVWQGKPYEDKGRIIKWEPHRRIEYSHFSPLSGLPDTLDNYRRVAIDLIQEGTRTRVSLSQDNNDTDEAREHSERNWRMMLDGLKKAVKGQHAAT